VDEYAAQLAASIDTCGVAEADLKVVVDTGLGAASLVMPRILTTLGITVLTVNNRLDEDQPTSTQSSYHAAMARLGELVASSRSDLGVRFDPTGERLSLVDETGRPFDHGRALLVLLDLVAAERRSGVVALPADTTRVAEAVTAFHGVAVERGGSSTSSLTRLAQRPDLIFAGDGRGGFIVPEVGPTVDGIAAFVRLVGLVARTKLTLSAIDRRIPEAHIARTSAPTPWARRGAVMRRLVEEAGSRAADAVEGVRIREQDGSWVLAVPDDVEPVIRLWAESHSDESADRLLAQWSGVIEEAAADA
jgi:mannose-1-phosphate guanylyltransferase/phosphomannomutase